MEEDHSKKEIYKDKKEGQEVTPAPYATDAHYAGQDAWHMVACLSACW